MSRWDVAPRDAVALQKELRERVRLTPLRGPVHLIGGADVSMDRFATEGHAGFVTLTYPGLELVDHSVVRAPIRFPYVPGLLSFREIPMLLRAWAKLTQKPDVIIMDGVGIAHPRRLGIATHLGLELGVPTIGCAKSVLTGIYKEPGRTAGSATPLKDPKAHGEVIGMALRTKDRVKPVFVSPGNGITLEESVALVRGSVRRHRLPEPTRLAHLTVNEYRRRG